MRDLRTKTWMTWEILALRAERCLAMSNMLELEGELAGIVGTVCALLSHGGRLAVMA